MGANRQRPLALVLLHRFKNLELMEGLEPSTSPLPRECSTTELHQLLPAFRVLLFEPAHHHAKREKP